MRKAVLVIFGKEIPIKKKSWWQQFDVIVASTQFKSVIDSYRLLFVDIDSLIETGSIYEANAFLEELSLLKLPNGSLLAKSFTYKGYELWWTHYNSLFLYFCLPYTQYKKLLNYLKNFSNVSLYHPSYGDLFSCYLRAYQRRVIVARELSFQSPAFLPFGVLLQLVITLLCLPILMVRKYSVLVFTGDKFEKTQDYDFRMKFVYKDLRQKNISFVEFIRSRESWWVVLQHAFTRKRPVIYSEAVAFVGRFCSIISGGRRWAKHKFGPNVFASETNPEARFKLLVATQYLLGVHDDIWAIRIMRWILRAIKIKASFITAALERNFNTVLGCKLNNIPIVGILHGIASQHYNVYDFMPEFDGEKNLSVDKYGLWSEWWKEFYFKNSKTYRPEQLYISGPMRPLEKDTENFEDPIIRRSGPTKVLFISEQLAALNEAMSYLEELIKNQTFDLSIKFRPSGDGFEEWLLENQPQLIEKNKIRILRGNIQDAIKECDVVVGSHSTAVLEALFHFKIPIFFNTQKWGDCFKLKDYGDNHPFFAENPQELIEKIKNTPLISGDGLRDLRERYFGDPYKNGSRWVVEQLEEYLG